MTLTDPQKILVRDSVLCAMSQYQDIAASLVCDTTMYRELCDYLAQLGQLYEAIDSEITPQKS